ncbi:MAG: AAA family ATPase [Nitrospirota bacterium]
MISTIEIQNFRCFEKLNLDGLSRINLLVGKNATGKTAFLESLFLVAAGSAEVFLRLRGWRGFGDVLKITYERRFYESLWRDLFYAFDQNRQISIRTSGTHGADRSLKIYYRSEESLTIPILEKRDDMSVITPIRMEWTISGGKTFEVKPALTPRGLNVGQFIDPLPGSLFASFHNPNAEENAAHFSELSKQGKEGELVKALNREFPYIQGLSVEIDSGSPMVYARLVAPSISRRLPLTLVSGGINKFVSLLLAIASNPHGVVYVDEIENGFYYDRLSTIWSSLFTFAKDYDVQLIASTHSLDCLRALSPLLKENQDDFRLLRAERQDDRCNIRMFSGKELRSAMDQDLEVR